MGFYSDLMTFYSDSMGYSWYLASIKLYNIAIEHRHGNS